MRSWCMALLVVLGPGPWVQASDGFTKTVVPVSAVSVHGNAFGGVSLVHPLAVVPLGPLCHVPVSGALVGVRVNPFVGVRVGPVVKVRVDPVIDVRRPIVVRERRRLILR